jgi:TPR repeat protein
LETSEEVDHAPEASHWYEEAAQRGSAQAMFSLAKLYEEGEGSPEMWPVRATTTPRAAEAGLAEASEALWRLSGERKTAPAPPPTTTA